MTQITFQALLEGHCYASRLSVPEIAKRANISLGTLRHWLDGSICRVRFWQPLVKLAQALTLDQIQTDQLLKCAGLASLAVLERQAADHDRDLLSYWQTQSSSHSAILDPSRLNFAPRKLPAIGHLPAGSRHLLRHKPISIGRQALIRAIAEHLRVASGRPIVICGMGGVGKTHLANEIVHRYGQFFVGGVFWLSFADPAAVAIEIAACGGQNHLALDERFAELTLHQQTQLVQQAWAEDVPRLLILDGCEDETLVHNWLPMRGGCRVIITTRRIQWDTAVHLTKLIPFQAQESIQLIRALHPDVQASDAVLNAIAAQVGQLPLALGLVARYLRRYRFALLPNDYLDQLLQLGVQESSTDPTMKIEYLASPLTLSLQRLDPACPVDAFALSILLHQACFLPGEPVTRSLLHQTIGIDYSESSALFRAEEAFIRLVNLGLIEDHRDIRLHPLLAQLVARLYDLAPMRRQVATTLTTLTQNYHKTGLIIPVLAYQQHLRHGANTALSQNADYAATLCQVLGEHLWRASLIDEAHTWNQRALDLAQQNASHEDQEKALNLLALSALALSDYSQAETASHARINLLQTMTNVQPQLAEEHNNLGFMLIHCGRYDEACTTLRQALHQARQLQGDQSLRIARILHNLGYLAYKNGMLKRAWRLIWAAISIRLNNGLAIEHPAVVFSLCTLGEILFAQGQTEQALRIFDSSLSMREMNYPGEHYATAESLLLLATALAAISDAHADAMFERAHTMIHNTLGAKHRLMIQHQTNYGRYLIATQQLKQAEQVLQISIKYAEEIFGNIHPDRATAIYELGQLMVQRRQFQIGLGLFNQAAAIRQQTLWAGHYQHAEIACAQAALLIMLERKAEALSLMNQVMHQIRHYQLEHPSYQQLCALHQHTEAAIQREHVVG